MENHPYIGTPETIRIFLVYHGADDIQRPISDISTMILVIQSIFNLLELQISKILIFQVAKYLMTSNMTLNNEEAKPIALAIIELRIVV